MFLVIKDYELKLQQFIVFIKNKIMIGVTIETPNLESWPLLATWVYYKIDYVCVCIYIYMKKYYIQANKKYISSCF